MKHSNGTNFLFYFILFISMGLSLSGSFTIHFSWTSDITSQLNSIFKAKMLSSNNTCLKSHIITINYIESSGNISYFKKEKNKLDNMNNLIVSGIFNDMLNFVSPNLNTGFSNISAPLKLQIDPFPTTVASNSIIKFLNFYKALSETFVLFCDNDLASSFELTANVINALIKPSTIFYLTSAKITDDEIMQLRQSSLTHFIAFVAPKNSLLFATFMNNHNFFSEKYMWFFLNSNYHTVSSQASFNVITNKINLIEFSDKNLMMADSELLILNDAVEIWLLYLRNLLCESIINDEGISFNGMTGKYLLLPQVLTKISWKVFAYNGFNFDNTNLINTMIINEKDDNSTLKADKNNFTIDYTFEDLLRNLKLTGIKYSAFIKAPFVYWNDNHTELTGICIEIINEVCRRLNTTCRAYLGSPLPTGNSDNPTINSFNEVMNKLLLGEVDIIVGAFRNLVQRNNVAKPLVTLFSFNKSVLIRNERSQRNQLLYMFQFLSPQDQLVWYIQLGAIFASAIILTFVSCCMPNKNSFNLYNSIALKSYAILMRWPLHAPDRFSSRLVVGIFWLFSLLCILFYHCNYVAEITSVQLQADKLHFYSVPEQNDYLYGLINNTDSFIDLQESEYDYPFQIYKNTIVLDTIWPNESEALNFVYGGDYGLIDDDPYNYYLMYKSCNLTVQGQGYSGMYTFYVQQENPFYEEVFNGVLKGMVKERFTNTILDKYMSMYKSANDAMCTDNKTFLGVVSNIFRYDANLLLVPYGLNLEQSVGLFGILIAGCVLSIIIALLECCVFAIRRCCKRRNEKKKKAESVDEY